MAHSSPECIPVASCGDQYDAYTCGSWKCVADSTAKMWPYLRIWQHASIGLDMDSQSATSKVVRMHWAPCRKIKQLAPLCVGHTADVVSKKVEGQQIDDSNGPCHGSPKITLKSRKWAASRARLFCSCITECRYAFQPSDFHAGTTAV